jgi:hypothetical protein
VCQDSLTLRYGDVLSVRVLSLATAIPLNHCYTGPRGPRSHRDRESVVVRHSRPFPDRSALAGGVGKLAVPTDRRVWSNWKPIAFPLDSATGDPASDADQPNRHQQQCNQPALAANHVANADQAIHRSTMYIRGAPTVSAEGPGLGSRAV